MIADQPSDWERAVSCLRSQVGGEQLVKDAYYDDPPLTAAKRYASSPEFEEILRLLQPQIGGKVVEVGAGRGIASYALGRAGFSVIAVEPDSGELVGRGAIEDLASTADLDIETLDAVAERLPLEANSVDVVFARATLHHCSDLQAACKEFHRVLRPGGVLLAVREHVISRHQDLDVFLDNHPLHHLYGGEHAYLLSEYRSAIAGAGMTLRRVMAPLGSAINYSPKTIQDLKREVADRLPGNVWRTLLEAIPDAVGQRVFSASRFIDNRPGRLYSFMAVKP